ncbi:hypothetical protein [Nonomuraea gerenzanensis]|uniref:Uncharacterized protein n=1 Tax=Nonomuraea gerenzanensis TaxID=93944 RepID=A0A1M4BKZ5_9ACTN|nr:hypothetical protein [Nonomuraea gerenzanensis]UBU10049.1 hypothetical protein LCN96_37610 [Nonomuraea gerenzanensis]SAP16326.1 hypothetical protein BN4615_P10989 [Nonomuraea gerenzanensis]
MFAAVVFSAGNTLAIGPLAAVLLIGVGIVAAGVAVAVIAYVVRLAGARPGRLLPRDGESSARTWVW